MHRRQVLKTAAAFCAWSLTSGHTPYKQWDVYRRKHLLIGTNKADPPTYELGKRIAAVLLKELPESRARVARAPHAWRLASLITTDQIQLVLLAEEDVRALRDGLNGFEAFGKTELRALFRFGAYWLICQPDFSENHAVLLTRTLLDHGAGIAKISGIAGNHAPVPVHPAIESKAKMIEDVDQG